MGNCFNKNVSKDGFETKTIMYSIQHGDESLALDEIVVDPEMQALVKPMPTKPLRDPLKEDAIPYAIWKTSCMNQLK